MTKYSELNDLLCDEVFPAEKSFRPAYVEIDDDVEISLMEFFDCKQDEIRGHITELVAERISQTGTTHDPFVGIHRNLLNWRKSLAKEPSNYPEIPLLLTFTFAAVDMGGAGGQPTSLDEMSEQAMQLAQQLVSMPDYDRKQQLKAIREGNNAGTRENEKQGRRLVLSYPIKCQTDHTWKYDGYFDYPKFSYGNGTEYESGTFHNFQIRIEFKPKSFGFFLRRFLLT
jgi:hypothetical protein